MDFQWLENLEDPRANSWAATQSDLTLNELKSYPSFDSFYNEALDICSSSGGLPYRYVSAGYFYDLFTSQKNPMGIWRRCKSTEFEKEMPQWENMLDLDQFSKDQKDEWNFDEAFHSPEGKRVLLSLSHRGKDKHWVREFDLESKSFVVDGFEVPLAKSTASWLDENTIIVGGDIPETTNQLGYSKVLRLWKRGHSEKPILVESNDTDFGIWSGGRLPKDDFAYIYLYRDWDHCEIFTYSAAGDLKKLFLPPVTREVFRFGHEIVFLIHQDYKNYLGGSILSANLDDVLANEMPHFEIIWSPTDRTFGTGCFRHRDQLVITFLENVHQKCSFLSKENGNWAITPIPLPSGLDVTNCHHDSWTEDTFFRVESFTTPPALFKWEPENLKKIKSLKPQFHGDFATTQKWAQSRDGTLIPYFLIHKKDLKIGELTPTLLNGYGGFNLARTPTYLPVSGKLWLERGGIWVIANIRGGGEFGPAWHLTARKENKQRSYDDFIAVAEDLIKAKITNPKRLGIYGGSNGGLLVGAVAMQRPELFGAVLCTVPLLDMMRYVDLPPGSSWMDEYGNPNDPKMKEIILKYSPYQNIHPDRNYPKIFFMTSSTDDRVHPSHARRMAAKMKAMGKDCYFYEETSGGHKGGNNHVEALDEALKFSYLWKQLAP